MFLHNSVKTDYFKSDKKLTLLQDGVITIEQFVSLIDPRDEYIAVGPAIVAKSAVKDFILEWKMKQLQMGAVRNGTFKRLTYDDFMAKMNDLVKVFPETAIIFNEFKEQLKIAVCPICVKKQYIGVLTKKIRELKDDGRDISLVADFIGLLNIRFSASESDEPDEKLLSNYDVEWIKPESLVGLGFDLVKNLESCYECTIKHIGRAKALYEEFLLGYPDHIEISFDELDKGTKAVEQAYLSYLDSMSQLDMASCELARRHHQLAE